MPLSEREKRRAAGTEKAAARRRADDQKQQQGQLSPQPKRATLQVLDMLTPAEIDELRRVQLEQFAILQKEFPKVKIVR